MAEKRISGRAKSHRVFGQSRKPAKVFRAVDEERYQSQKDTQDSDGIDPIDLMLVDQSLPDPDAVALHDL
jgi:hypothetical protein